jgi:hypothetical protein
MLQLVRAGVRAAARVSLARTLATSSDKPDAKQAVKVCLRM